MSELELRQIPGFPDYFARSDGEIISYRKNAREPFVMKKQTTHDGFYRVVLSRGPKKGSIKMKILVHELVARAFLGDPSSRESRFVRHKNDVSVDNRPENLCYGTLHMSELEIRQIPGFPEYFARSDGEIVSYRKNPRKPFVMKKESLDHGYYRVTLSHGPKRGGTNMKILVHVLVARAFLGDPPSRESRFVRHKNDVSGDNRPENLCYGTRYRNLIDDKIRNGKYKLTKEKVKLIREMLTLGYSYSQIEEQFGISKQAVSNIANRKIWKRIGITPRYLAWLESGVRGNSKLSAKEIIEIRWKLMTGHTFLALSKEYSVTTSYIRYIAIGAIRKRVPMSPEFAAWSERYKNKRLAF